MTPEEVAHSAQQEFLWKGVTGIVTALSLAVVALFGWLMRSKDNHITRLDSKVELLERQAIDREREHRAELKKQRDEYDAKLDEARRERSLTVRQRARAARLAEQALFHQNREDPVPDESFDEEDENTEIRCVRAESREMKVQEELRRRKEAAAREQERIDRQARAYLRGESPPPSQPPPSLPPPKPYRGKLPSRRG